MTKASTERDWARGDASGSGFGDDVVGWGEELWGGVWFDESEGGLGLADGGDDGVEGGWVVLGGSCGS